MSDFDELITALSHVVQPAKNVLDTVSQLPDVDAVAALTLALGVRLSSGYARIDPLAVLQLLSLVVDQDRQLRCTQ